MATVKQWCIENVSTAFVSIRVGEQIHGIPPGEARPLTRWFGGSAETARANASVKALVEQGAVRLYERDVVIKVGNQPCPWNQDDPEDVRVAKVLEHRRRVKEAAAGKPTPNGGATKKVVKDKE